MTFPGSHIVGQIQPPSMDDWREVLKGLGVLGGAVVATVAAWDRWFRSRGDARRDYTKMTMDGVFLLVNQYQEDSKAKDEEIDRLRLRIDSLDRRLMENDARCQEQISNLRTRLDEAEKANRLLMVELEQYRGGKRT